MKRRLFAITFILFFSLSGKSELNLDSLVVYNPKKAYAITHAEIAAPTFDNNIATYGYFLEACLNLGYYPIADSVVNWVFPHAENLPDSEAKMGTLRQIARLDAINQRYIRAIELYQEIAVYYFQHNLYADYAQTLVNIAEFYRITREFDAGLEKLNEVMQLHEEHRLPPAILANVYHRMAAIENETSGDAAMVIYYSKKSLQYSEAVRHILHMATSYNELGFTYFKLGEDTCLHFFNKAMKVWKSIDGQHDVVNTLANMARYHVIKSNFKEADNHLSEALHIANEYGISSAEYEILELLAEVKYRQNAPAEAYELSKRAREQHINFLQKQYMKSLKLLGRNKERELALARLDVAEEQRLAALSSRERESSDKKKALGGSLVLLSSLVFGSVLYFKLRKSHSEIKNKNQIIESQVNQLNQTLGQKDMLVREVHHRVKNNLQIIIALLELQDIQLNDENQSRLIEDVMRRITAMSLVHEHLYDKSDMGSINIAEYMKKLIEQLEGMSQAGASQIGVISEVDSISLDISDTICLGMIVSELYTNSIKYAFQDTGKPLIYIELKKSDPGHINLRVRDNGSGYSDNAQCGLGSRLIDMFVRQLKGQAEYISSDGFTFQLNFPVK